MSYLLSIRYLFIFSCWKMAPRFRLVTIVPLEDLANKKRNILPIKVLNFVNYDVNMCCIARIQGKICL